MGIRGGESRQKLRFRDQPRTSDARRVNYILIGIHHYEYRRGCLIQIRTEQRMPELGKRYLRVEKNGYGEASGATEVRTLARLKTQETCLKAFRIAVFAALSVFATQTAIELVQTVFNWLSAWM